MTATITEVREAAAAVIGALTSLSGKQVTGYAYPPGTADAPAAIVSIGEGEFLTYRSSQTSRDLSLIIGVFVQAADRESAFKELDAFLNDAGTQSIYAAFAADPTMGGLIDDISIISASNYGELTYNGVDYYGFELAAEVML